METVHKVIALEVDYAIVELDFGMWNFKINDIFFCFYTCLF